MNDKQKKIQEREQNLKAQLTPNTHMGETSLFIGLCSLTKTDNTNQPQKIGNGMAQILKSNTNSRHRLLIRDSNNLDNPFLNCYILPFGELKKFSDSKYQFDAIDYAQTVSKYTYIICFTNDDTGKQFKTIYLQAFISNKQLLNSLGL